MSVSMATGAYTTPLRVHARSPGTAPTGTPAGGWFEIGRHWAQLVESGGAEVQAGQGQRHTRRVALRLRWFPGWESALHPAYRVRVGVQEPLLSIVAIGEEPQVAAGTQRTLRLELQGVL